MSGGALFIAGGAGAVTGSTFRNNSSGSLGGAIRSDGGNLSVFSSSFDANTATIGGGAVSSNGVLVVNGSQFTNNAALGAFSNGACNPPICNQGQGGAVYGASAVTLQANTFTTNTAKLQGGAVYAAGAINVTGGSAAGNRAGLPQDAGNPNRGEGGAFYGNAAVTVSGTPLTGNQAARQGGGIFAVGALNVTNVVLLGNTANGATSDSEGGAIYARNSLAVVGSTLQGNVADVAAAAFVTTAVGAPPTVGITATRVVSNSGLGAGGVVLVDANSPGRSVSIAGSLFAGNVVALGLIGRVVTLDNTTTSVRNSTFADGPGTAPSLAASNSTVTVRNSLFRGYAPGVLVAFSVASISSDYNLFTVAPYSVLTGPNSIVADPLFVNPGAGDYRLQTFSPAVDAGNDAALPASLTTDLNGQPRKVNGNPNRPALVDVGAFEMQRLAPAAVAGGPYNGVEGSPVALDASASTGTPPFTFGWDCANDGTVDVQGNAPTGLACTYADNGAYVARLVISDSVGFTSTPPAPVAVANVAPVLTPPAAGQFTGVTLDKSFAVGSFADAGVLDFPWDVGVNWGDGNVSQLSVNVQGALPPQTHTYAVAGTRTVTVTVTDKDGGPGSAVFTVTVDPAPVAVADGASVTAGGSLLLDVLDNDGGVGLALTAVGPASQGSASIEAGKARFDAPEAGGVMATFAYTVTDRNGATASATVTVEVDAAPVAVDDTETITAGASILIDVLGNDSGVQLSLSSVSTPTLGSATIEAGKVRFDAPASAGDSTFTYSVVDRNGTSASATVSVTVTPPPVPGESFQYLPGVFRAP